MINVNDKYAVVWRPGMTVQDVLDDLHFSFRLIVVRVDGRPVPRPDFARTAVPDGARMEAIHLTSGG